MKKIFIFGIIGLFIVVSIFAYSPPTYNNINLVLNGSYTPPAYTSINLVLGEEGTNPCTPTSPNWAMTQDCVLTTCPDPSIAITVPKDVTLTIPFSCESRNTYIQAGGTRYRKF